ncbi:MAG: flagellin [Planctomycetes bacterium]|nr:flagellin [Planctomycetota bacterium]
MGLRINTNSSALSTLYRLSQTQARIGKSLEKLGTSLGINRAADDPSGLTISEQLRAQVAGVRVMIKSTQRSINMIQTAESALNEISGLLVGMREKAVSAANSGGSGREQLEAEQFVMDKMIASIDRISQTTRFGSKSLLNGAHRTETDTTDGIESVIIRTANFNYETTRTFNVRVLQNAEKAQIDVSANNSGTTRLRITGNLGSEIVTVEGAHTVSQMEDIVNDLSAFTGVDAANGKYQSQTYGSKSFVRVELVSGDDYAGPDDAQDYGKDVIAFVGGSLAQGDGLKATVSSSQFDGDVYFAPGASYLQQIQLTKHTIELNPGLGPNAITIALPSLSAGNLGHVTSTRQSLPDVSTSIPATNSGSNSGPGQGEGVLTLNNIPADLNGATYGAYLLVPSDNYTIDFSFDNSEAGVNLDGATLSITADRTVNGVAAGGNLVTVPPVYASDTDSFSLAVTASDGGTIKLTASISDTNGDLVAERTYTYSSKAATASDTPFEDLPGASQDFRLVFDRDQVNINIGAATIAAGANGEEDFFEDLQLWGLRSAGGDAADASALAQIKTAIFGKLNTFYAGANVNFGEETMANVTADWGATEYDSQGGGSDPGYSTMAVGGARLVSGAVDSSSYVIGYAQTDPGANNLQNNNTAEILGVFPARLFQLEKSFNDAAFRAIFDEFAPSLGGTAIGEWTSLGGVTDNDLLTGTPPGAPDETARLSALNSAIQAYANAAGAIIAHEVGHSLGLVPNGAPPKGFFGESSDFSGSTSAHLNYNSNGIVGVMNPSASWSAMQGTAIQFNPLDKAYLQGKLLFNQSYTEGALPLFANYEWNAFQTGAPKLAASETSLADLDYQTALAEGVSGSLSDLKSGGQYNILDDPYSAMSIIDEALSQVNALRGFLGGLTSKLLQPMIESQTVHAENLTKSESTIRDLDYAAEATNLVKQQVLFQSSVSILQQANLIPQTVLSLLG